MVYIQITKPTVNCHDMNIVVMIKNDIFVKYVPYRYMNCWNITIVSMHKICAVKYYTLWQL